MSNRHETNNGAGGHLFGFGSCNAFAETILAGAQQAFETSTSTVGATGKDTGQQMDLAGCYPRRAVSGGDRLFYR